MNNKVGIALVGAGVIGKRHLMALQQIDELELLGIADAAPSTGRLAAEYSVPFFETAEKLIDSLNPAGVIVATPTEHHFEPTAYALRNDAHVLVEKPIMATLDEAEKVIALSLEKNRHVLVGHQRRYYGLVKRAKEIIAQDSFGQLVAVSGQWNMRKHDSYYDPDWRKKWQAGPILTNLIHEMDLLRYIVGDIVSLSADIGHTVQGFEKEDCAAINLRFANGVLGSFIISDQTHSPWAWESATGENLHFPRTGENCIRFMGTSASLDFPNLRVWSTQGADPEWRNNLHAVNGELPLEDPYVEQLRHFAQVINGQHRPVVNARDATETLRAVLSVYKSADTGRRIDLSR